MAKLGTEAMRKQIRDSLGRDLPDDMGRMDPEDLADAMSHPKASEVIAEMMGREPGSAQQGEPAPDFTLPWLPGSGEGRGAQLSLSEHFGKRPVALIFGSYT